MTLAILASREALGSLAEAATKQTTLQDDAQKYEVQTQEAIQADDARRREKRKASPIRSLNDGTEPLQEKDKSEVEKAGEHKKAKYAFTRDDISQMIDQQQVESIKDSLRHNVRRVRLVALKLTLGRKYGNNSNEVRACEDLMVFTEYQMDRFKSFSREIDPNQPVKAAAIVLGFLEKYISDNPNHRSPIVEEVKKQITNAIPQGMSPEEFKNLSNLPLGDKTQNERDQPSETKSSPYKKTGLEDAFTRDDVSQIIGQQQNEIKDHQEIHNQMIDQQQVESIKDSLRHNVRRVRLVDLRSMLKRRYSDDSNEVRACEDLMVFTEYQIDRFKGFSRELMSDQPVKAAAIVLGFLEKYISDNPKRPSQVVELVKGQITNSIPQGMSLEEFKNLSNRLSVE